MKTLQQHIAENKALHQNVNIAESKILHQNVNIEEKLLINKNLKPDSNTNDLVDDIVKYLCLDSLTDIKYCRNRWNLQDTYITDTDLHEIMKNLTKIIDANGYQNYNPKDIQYRCFRKQKKQFPADIAKRYKTVAQIPVIYDERYKVFGKKSLYIEYIKGSDFLRIAKCGPYGGVISCEFIDDYMKE